MPRPLSMVESRYGMRKSPVSMLTVLALAPYFDVNSLRFSMIRVRRLGKFSRV